MKRLLFLSFIATTAVAADQPSPAELKMREALRNTMLQLRTAETEKANLQAANTELTEKNKASEEKVTALSKQLADDKVAADKTAAELVDKVAQRDTDIVQLKEALEKWKAGYAQVLTVAKTKEAERARFEAKSIALDRVVADQQRKNATMYQLGTEVLSRYEKFGLGDALLSREQFIGITRVKFENLMQDYADKLSDAKIKPTATPAPVKSEKPARPQKSERAAKSDQRKPAATPTPKPAKGAHAVS